MSKRRDTCAGCGERMWDGLVGGPHGETIYVSGCLHCHTRYERPMVDVQIPETLPMFEVDEP